MSYSVPLITNSIILSPEYSTPSISDAVVLLLYEQPNISIAAILPGIQASVSITVVPNIPSFSTLGVLSASVNITNFGDIASLTFSPQKIIPGYNSDGINITIPISVLPGLTIEEANPISGSWIDIFQAICIKDHEYWSHFSSTTSPQTIDSWNNRNMNAKSPIFQYGTGELNTFLKHFTISYGITHPIDEN